MIKIEAFGKISCITNWNLLNDLKKHNINFVYIRNIMVIYAKSEGKFQIN